MRRPVVQVLIALAVVSASAVLSTYSARAELAAARAVRDAEVAA